MANPELSALQFSVAQGLLYGIPRELLPDTYAQLLPPDIDSTAAKEVAYQWVADTIDPDLPLKDMGNVVLTLRAINRTEVIKAIGRIDSNNASVFGGMLDDEVDAGENRLAVDFGGIEYISSACLREMVRILKRVKRSGGDLKIANPSNTVANVLDLAGLSTIFETHPSAEKADEAFDKPAK